MIHILSSERQYMVFPDQVKLSETLFLYCISRRLCIFIDNQDHKCDFLKIMTESDN